MATGRHCTKIFVPLLIFYFYLSLVFTSIGTASSCFSTIGTLIYLTCVVDVQPNKPVIEAVLKWFCEEFLQCIIN